MGTWFCNYNRSEVGIATCEECDDWSDESCAAAAEHAMSEGHCVTFIASHTTEITPYQYDERTFRLTARRHGS